MNSTSSSFLLEQVNTKYEAYRLIHDPTRLISLLFSKYGDIEEDLYLFYINQIMYNLPSKFNCLFKEINYSNLTNDYLKRFYRINETIIRLPKLSDYYKNYHLFFCRPTLRHRKLCKIMCNFQDKRAEIFYKNNYKESKENISNEREENNNRKKTSSSSLTSLDNITNNKIIFDKYTKKMLDKSETEIKNNNYYNTLILETSRSNLLLSNGLISKRTGGDSSFEKCIHALVDYQFNKNKNKNIIKKKINKKLNKNLKNIILNNSNKLSKIKNNISQSQRASFKLYNFKMKKNNSKILSNKKRKINSGNNSISKNFINKVTNQNTKNSLYILTNNIYNTSTNTLLINKNNRKINNIKELNLNQPVTTTNKDTKKNKTYIYSNNNTINNTGNNSKNDSNTMSINLNSNINLINNLKLGNDNIKKLSKLSEYLKHIKSKDNNNFNQKSSLHKKNCSSIGESENKNILFNLNHKKRITKKRIILNKNLKMTITNGNINTNTYKPNPKHTKNKTFDFNLINQNQKNNNTIKSNNNLIINEEFNTLINKKPKKTLYKIIINSNNFTINQNKQKTKKTTKSNKNILSPAIKKVVNKICVTQKNSKEKNYKKNLDAKIFTHNNRIKLYSYNKDINSPPNSKVIKSVFNNDNDNKTIKDSLIKSSKVSKSNYNLSPNVYGIKNILSPKNFGSSISSTNQIYNNIIYSKRSINIKKNNNNFYIKKSINKDNNRIIEEKEDKNNLINSCNFNNSNQELYSNIVIPTYNSNNNEDTSNNLNNKKLSRNKKKYSYKNYNNSKKNSIHTKTNSSINTNPLNTNCIINNNINLNNDNLKNNIKNNGNINISIEKNNINIKDSILHIDKIYIKKDNSNRKFYNHPIIYEKDGISNNKGTIEIKLGEQIIKTDGNDIRINNEKIKSLNYSPLEMNYSPKAINVHRNYNLHSKNNKEIKK